jgi:hypothetical protein
MKETKVLDDVEEKEKNELVTIHLTKNKEIKIHIKQAGVEEKKN